jgi:hypothetical protein
VDSFGGDFRQGLQYESSLVHQRVRDDQFLAADDVISIQEEIQVDRARLPAIAADAA